MTTETDEGWEECSDPHTLTFIHALGGTVQIEGRHGGWADLPAHPARPYAEFDLAVNRIGWRFRIPTTTYITQEASP